MAIEPINESRHFAVDELFFSTTDPKGRIQRANRVFQRIAGYTWEQLHNRPHNIIRHPEMPRAIFQIFWDYLLAGRPVAAFVKNMANDGRYYWVVALANPIPGGFLSVRFKPTSPLLGQVSSLYAALRTLEVSIEDRANDRKAAIAASTQALGQKLGALGFANYDAFMRHILKHEMASRDEQLSAAGAQHQVAGKGIHNKELDERRETAALFDKLITILNALFADLEVYTKINQVVRAKSESVTEISESFRVSALNGVIAVAKLGSATAGLRPVLGQLRALSGEITKESVRLSGALDDLVKDVELVEFDLNAARLQVQMTSQFAYELLQEASEGDTPVSADRAADASVEVLHASSCETVKRALSHLATIKGRLDALTDSQARLLETSHSLRPIYLTGRIEMAEGAGARLATVFKDVGDQLEETATNLDGLKAVLADLEAHLAKGLAHAAAVEETIEEIDSHLRVAV